MPSYEYKCSSCENITAIMRKVDDRDEAVECEKCGEKSERYVNCKYPQCNKHFICCENCAEEDGRSFCSTECREKVLSTV